MLRLAHTPFYPNIGWQLEIEIYCIEIKKSIIDCSLKLIISRQRVPGGETLFHRSDEGDRRICFDEILRADGSTSPRGLQVASLAGLNADSPVGLQVASLVVWK
jgi:hypothetical protein